MKVLVVGSGGREHTLVWKLRQSPRVKEVFVAPGNGGMHSQATCVGIDSDDIAGLAGLAEKESIDLTVVGPEAPLALGISDEFERRGLKVFGPSARAAELESSKVFSKELMTKYGIPTAEGAVYDEPGPAREEVRRRGAPLVVKADGLAAGKGVIVAGTVEEALAAVDDIMVRKVFGDAGRRVIVEECLVGEEASIVAFTDGTTVLPLLAAQDHKAVYDGDRGPNTGGMGAYAPAPVVTGELAEQVKREVLIPTVQGMAAEGRLHRGVLYAGLMITAAGPKVLEYNVRFGDPETQPTLALLESDILDPVLACVEGGLDGVELRWSEGAAVCVVVASGGYPGKYEKGKRIEGLTEADGRSGVMVFHSGTAVDGEGNCVTAGGRVLGVTALGSHIVDAIDRAYEAVGRIQFDGMYFRRDIGKKAVERISGEAG